MQIKYLLPKTSNFAITASGTYGQPVAYNPISSTVGLLLLSIVSTTTATVTPTAASIIEIQGSVDDLEWFTLLSVPVSSLKVPVNGWDVWFKKLHTGSSDDASYAYRYFSRTSHWSRCCNHLPPSSDPQWLIQPRKPLRASMRVFAMSCCAGLPQGKPHRQTSMLPVRCSRTTKWIKWLSRVPLSSVLPSSCPSITKKICVPAPKYGDGSPAQGLP